MFLVILAGFCLAAFQLHPAFGFLITGILSLAQIRTAGAINQARAMGLPIRPSVVIRTFVVSILVAATILGLSLIPGLCLMPAFNMPQMHAPPEFGLSSLVGVLFSAFVAIPIAILLRRCLW
ncbi:hypothetical protein SAMN05444166_5595 [Singulisphaera sp. GP187]|nr:hypothetical protein SAMN05444166_5595 [Singulisphaera sp. GP187]